MGIQKGLFEPSEQLGAVEPGAGAFIVRTQTDPLVERDIARPRNVDLPRVDPVGEAVHKAQRRVPAWEAQQGVRHFAQHLGGQCGRPAAHGLVILTNDDLQCGFPP